ncbi:phage tail assembly chaperone [Robertmurraya siralis]|uniref:phage tail assembly chaperone n=1 Tax=Robertmurraya siralis TaxID=77777 RepID=UPI0010F9D577|nr:phage portal protein [Robertmurraya siralis]
MSNLQAFFAQNVEKVEMKEVVVSTRFKGEDGKPMKWQVAPVTADEDAAFRKSATKRMPLPGKKNVYQPETDYDLYVLKLTAACVKFPDLNNADLQNSYGVMGAENLLKKMLLPGEYAELTKIIQEVNNFDVTMDELVEEAKN